MGQDRAVQGTRRHPVITFENLSFRPADSDKLLGVRLFIIGAVHQRTANWYRGGLASRAMPQRPRVEALALLYRTMLRANRCVVRRARGRISGCPRETHAVGLSVNPWLWVRSLSGNPRRFAPYTHTESRQYTLKPLEHNESRHYVPVLPSSDCSDGRCAGRHAGLSLTAKGASVQQPWRLSL
jgi:hypothetical protein